MTRYSLVRKAAEPLIFEGDKIASASSYEDGKLRWTVLELYRRTDAAEGWVLSSIGCSALRNELELCNAVACVLPEDVARALLKSDSSSGTRRYYLPTVGLELLDAAIAADPRLAVLSEAVEDLV